MRISYWMTEYSSISCCINICVFFVICWGGLCFEIILFLLFHFHYRIYLPIMLFFHRSVYLHSWFHSQPSYPACNMNPPRQCVCQCLDLHCQSPLLSLCFSLALLRPNFLFQCKYTSLLCIQRPSSFEMRSLQTRTGLDGDTSLGGGALLCWAYWAICCVRISVVVVVVVVVVLARVADQGPCRIIGRVIFTAQQTERH